MPKPLTFQQIHDSATHADLARVVRIRRVQTPTPIKVGVSSFTNSLASYILFVLVICALFFIGVILHFLN